MAHVQSEQDLAWRDEALKEMAAARDEIRSMIARLTRELEEARERERAHRQWIEAIAVGVRVLAHESEPGPEGAVIVSARNLGELQHGVARALATPPAEGGRDG